MIQPKAAVVTAAKPLVKNTPHATNAADSAAVIQNTHPAWENILCILCIRKPSFPNTTRAE